MRAKVCTNEHGYRIGESHHRCRWPNAVVARCRDLHDEGVSAARICELTGVPWGTVRQWLYFQTRAQAPFIGEITYAGKRTNPPRSDAERVR